MQFGVMIFPTDLAIRPDELAREAEQRGFGSVFFPEHTHIPTSRKTPWPGGDDLPDEYRRTLDPFVAMTAAALATERIEVATGICLVAQHHPINLAKAVASVDHLSGGRVVLGIGFGWNVDEMESHGVTYRTRHRVVRETILACKELWTSDEASFEGEFVELTPSWMWPKPVRVPPILIGCAPSDLGFGHVVEYADGWMPIEGRYDIVERIEKLHQTAEEKGRDPSTIEVGVFGSRGTPEMLERYAEAGISRVVFGLPPRPRDEVLPVLDRRAELLTTVA